MNTSQPSKNKKSIVTSSVKCERVGRITRLTYYPENRNGLEFLHIPPPEHAAWAKAVKHLQMDLVNEVKHNGAYKKMLKALREVRRQEKV